jgi:hypothetical protein
MEMQPADQRGQMHSALRRLSSRATPLAWGGAGFLIGASFWHVIGVWGVLGTVVLTESEAAVPAVPHPIVMADTGLPNCTDLVLDRSTGQTRSVPCTETMPLLEEARHGRQDLAFADLRHQGSPRLTP